MYQSNADSRLVKAAPQAAAAGARSRARVSSPAACKTPLGDRAVHRPSPSRRAAGEDTRAPAFGSGPVSPSCDVPGFVTLKGDFHIHTVFSDGLVWPTVRADEAWREGLDVISITDHLEYQPHKADVSTNFNRSYELARGHGTDLDLLVVRGSEITRKMPPGHLNAIFLTNSASLAPHQLARFSRGGPPAGGLPLLEPSRLGRPDHQRFGGLVSRAHRIARRRPTARNRSGQRA